MPASGIISVSNEWNYDPSTHTVFAITALCKQDSFITVLHRYKQSRITKVRVVKSPNIAYIDLYVGSASGENVYYVSFSATTMMESIGPEIVAEAQDGYTIEEYNL